VFVDIGANYGLLSVWAAGIVGPTGRVHAFEPQPGILELLRRSVADNSLDQVTVYPLALSDQDGTMQLWVPDGHVGSASLTRIGESRGAPQDVEVRHAGEYLRSLGLSKVRLMKVDVEGHEDFVFQGAADWMGSPGPDVVIFEWNDPRPLVGSPTANLLNDLSYRVYGINEDPWRVRLHPLGTGAQRANDYLAARTETLRQGLAARLAITLD